MAIKISGENVQMTRKGAGVVLDVSFRELERWAAKNRLNEKLLWHRAYGRAIKGLKNKLQKVITLAGGVEGVPKFKDFEAFTLDLRRVQHKASPMGGILAEPHVIVAYKRGDRQIIGWPDRLADWAVKFQDAVGNESFLTSRENRYRLHRLGIKDIPRVYTHNPRRALPEPFATYARANLDDWAKHSFYKDLARQMIKSKNL